MGYVDRAVRIWVDDDKLDATQLTVTDVMSAAHAAARDGRPAGRMDTEEQQFDVRVLGEAADLATLKQIIIKNVAGAPIRLSDVALVEDGFEDITLDRARRTARRSRRWAS